MFEFIILTPNRRIYRTVIYRGFGYRPLNLRSFQRERLCDRVQSVHSRKIPTIKTAQLRSWKEALDEMYYQREEGAILHYNFSPAVSLAFIFELSGL